MITLSAVGVDIDVLFFGLIGLAAGFPVYATAATGIAQATGKSSVTATQHRQLGIVGLFVFGIMHNRGRHVPHWMDAFLVRLD